MSVFTQYFGVMTPSGDGGFRYLISDQDGATVLDSRKPEFLSELLELLNSMASELDNLYAGEDQ